MSRPTDDADLTIEALATAVRFGHPFSDALYVVLARRTAATLVTLDQRLHKLATSLKIDTV